MLLMSPPARGRGLKLKGGKTLPDTIKSPPARGRGLKHAECVLMACPRRRPPRGGVD